MEMTVISVVCCIVCVVALYYSNGRVLELKKENSKLKSKILQMNTTLNESIINRNKLTVEYLNLKDMFNKLEKYTSEIVKKLHGKLDIEIGNMLNLGDEEKVTAKNYNVDDILDEMNELGGFNRLPKDKQDFLTNNKY